MVYKVRQCQYIKMMQSMHVSWLRFSYKPVKMLSVCICLHVCWDVNQDATKRNCCTQRLVMLRAQTY